MERLTTKFKDGYLFNLPPINDEKAQEEYLEKLSMKIGRCEDAEEQGLLLKLPCKVGDTIYCFGFGGEIIEGVCKAIQIDERYKMAFIEGKDFCFWKMFEKFGKTVFLTKEEAEMKLAELTENRNCSNEDSPEQALAERKGV